MSASDWARFQLARRAFHAVQPSASEVQSGVRQARLSLLRARPRRSWFGRGLVLVLLGVGGLAYAKPHLLGDLAAWVRRDASHGMTRGGARSGAPVSASVSAPVSAKGTTTTGSESARPTPRAAAVSDPATTGTAPTGERTRRPDGKVASTSLSPGRSDRRRLSVAPAAPVQPARASEPPETVPNWGRIGQALARGDEAQALAGLSELSESDDPLTRDKAELGRAQLLLARGDVDQACSLARSLTYRHADRHLQSQARLLLKSCPP